MKVTTYQGFEIDFLEHREQWTFDPNNQKTFDTLKQCKAAIDTLISDGRKIDNVPVIVCSGWRNERRFANAQRWDGDGAVWVIDPVTKRRGKERATSCVLDTPEARKVFEENDRLRNKADELVKKAEQLIENLPRIK